MANHILFVFEGERTERQVYDNLSKHFVNENTITTCAFCADIYQLYEKVEADKYLDLFLLLKEMPQNKNTLNDFESSDFSQIYLFFDYDGHATKATDNKIIKLLSLFDEETDFGKLYLSYPMVEALKHYGDNIDFEVLEVKAKENIRYKERVDIEAHIDFKQIKKYDMKIWGILIQEHLKKMNKIVEDSYTLPDRNYEQNEIFENQLNKHIIPNNMVAVLSSFPIFLFDYYGKDTLEKKLRI